LSEVTRVPFASRAPATAKGAPASQVRFWNRSFMALVMAPEAPMADWFAALDRQLADSADFFRDRPVVVDLTTTAEVFDPAAGAIVLEGLEARGLQLVAVLGVDPAALAGTPWARLATALPGRDITLAPSAPPPAPPQPPPASLLIDQPVRSGQSVVHEAGDLIVVGSVASGAEVIAGGSIHVYGALRGRAIAGLRSGEAARIFCRKLEAELVGIDRLHRSAEHWGAALHGHAAQVFCDRGALTLSAFD
jgi:septum site-determining protein MinC